MTRVEVVSIYDLRSISGKPPEGTSIKFDDGHLLISRAIATYRRQNGEPWEFGLVRLTGTNDAGIDDHAILIRSDDWPEWLARFVDDNMPEDDSR